MALCTIQIPDFATLQIVKEKGGRSRLRDSWHDVSATEKKRTTETILYSLCIRAAYLVAKSDIGNWFDTVAVNAEQSWFDAATGTPRTGIIASLQASKAEIIQLNLEQADPKTCFRHLKGIATPSVEQVTAVRPIFVLNKADQRIVKEKNVAQGLDAEANLAAMPWDDFEHLVRQLFEWEFGRNGVEVKVTRASRDRGVDAIMFDPDPLRGGKYVLQAKRYTRPVDVAAVRDLYVPTIDIQKTCQVAAGAMLSLMGGTTTEQDVNACLDSEQKARDQSRTWRRMPQPTKRSACARTSTSQAMWNGSPASRWNGTSEKKGGKKRRSGRAAPIPCRR